MRTLGNLLIVLLFLAFALFALVVCAIDSI
jgi:hypothetical protein